MSSALPHDASLHGHHVDDLLRYLTTSTGVYFAVLTAILLIALLFHRSRGARRVAHYTHGTGAGARAVALLAGAIVLFGIDAVALVRSADRLRSGFWSYPDHDPRAVLVEVTAQQWAWNFRLPGADGRFNTPDDIVTLNDLRVPAHRPVVVQLRSKDVVHSFYLPNFRTKVDAIPGTLTRLWFQARETGTYELGCAQHCGAWHYKMRGTLTVMPDGDYATWLARAGEDAALRYDAADAEAHDGWAWMAADGKPMTGAR